MNISVNAPLHCLCKDEYRDGKSVLTVLEITLSEGHLFKHSGISVMLLSCILLLQ